MKKVLQAVLLTLLISTTLIGANGDVASAASSCGSRTTTQEYGVNVPLFGWKKVVTHSAKSRACENDVSITSNSYVTHSCSKTLIAFANSTNKSRTIGSSGGPEATNNFECDFSGGLVWKGVGIGVTRNMYITHRAYLNGGALWYGTTQGSTCC